MKSAVKLVVSGPVSNRHDDDFADRLSSRYTVLILVVFTVSLSAQLYIGKPITCWSPKEFAGSWVKYSASLCWVKNTYYLPLDANIPKSIKERKSLEIHYYQWLPFVLLFQALCFYLPSLVWNSFNQKAGVDCDSILAAANKYHKTDQDTDGRKRLQLLISNQFDRFLKSHPDNDSALQCTIRKILCCSLSLAHGHYLCMLYIVTKVLYMGNIILQFLLLDSILDTDFSKYGYNILKSIDKAEDVHSKIFPRVTLCDIDIRRVGNVNVDTLQCLLPINMYAEKIFGFMWVWLLVVGVATSVSILQWLFRFTVSNDKYHYIGNHLSSTSVHVTPESFSDPVRQKRALAEFVDSYLCMDGMFVLQLIGHNTNNMTVADTIRAIWDRWVRAEKTKIHENTITSTHI